MTKNSSTGGYILPAAATPYPENLSFAQFLQQVLVGISGLDGMLVRPRWAVYPAKQPDIFTNWLAYGVSSIKPDANLYSDVSPPTFASGFIELVCNPNNGDTLTVNSILITFVSVLTTGNQILIGGTVMETSNSLQSFLSTSSISQIAAATYTLNANVITVTAALVGTGGNAFTLSATGQTVLVSGPTLTAGSTDGNISQRHEELEIQCAFYGPYCQEYSSLVRDGFSIQQNLEALRSANMGFVYTSPALHVPDLINERWVDRIEMSVFLRREIMRSYPVLTLVSVSGKITAALDNSVKTVNFEVNV